MSLIHRVRGHRAAKLSLGCESTAGEYVCCWLEREGEKIDDAYGEIRFETDLRKHKDFCGWRDPTSDPYENQAEGWDMLPPGPVGYLTGIELPEELRGLGWGRKLEQGLIAGARREGVPHVFTLSTWEAIHFHEAMGFYALEYGMLTLMRLDL